MQLKFKHKAFHDTTLYALDTNTLDQTFCVYIIADNDEQCIIFDTAFKLGVINNKLSCLHGK